MKNWMKGAATVLQQHLERVSLIGVSMLWFFNDFFLSNKKMTSDDGSNGWRLCLVWEEESENKK